MSLQIFNVAIITVLACSRVSTADPLLEQPGESPPNVFIVMNANPIIKNGESLKSHETINELLRTGIYWSQFYANPISSATQASVLTGRYNIRTKSIGAGQARAMMATDEVTIGEAFSGAGYFTGFFGKWYLGSNFPLRCSDQGFQKTSVISNLSRDDGSTNPKSRLWVEQNHETIKTGDQIERSFGAARDFIKDSQTKHRPFLCVVSIARALPDENPIVSFDLELKKTLQSLKDQQIMDNTLIVIFNDSTNSVKQSNDTGDDLSELPTNGSLVVPLIISGPLGVSSSTIETTKPISAVCIMPTLMERCGLGVPEALDFDGVDLFKPVTPNEIEVQKHKPVVIQQQKGFSLNKYENFMLRSGNWKLKSLSQTEGTSSKIQLFDLSSDPTESTDLAQSEPDKLTAMKELYSSWFDDVTYTRIRDKGIPDILIDRNEENPVNLTWESRVALRDSSTVRGKWNTSFEHVGRFDVIVHIDPTISVDSSSLKAVLKIGKDITVEKQCDKAGVVLFEGISIALGKQDIEAKFVQNDGTTSSYAFRVTLIHR